MDELQFEEEWWRTSFDLDWAHMFAYKTRDAPREARTIQKMLGLPLKSKILDVCCGDGRITLQLARLGYDMTGLDLSLPLIQIAEGKAQRADLRISWVQGDMKEMRFSDRFDAVINVSTSFGYFRNESDNAGSLRSMAEALIKGGRLLLDIENIYYLAHMSRLYGTTPTYQPVNRFRSWLEETTFFDAASQVVKMRLRLWRRGRVVKDMKARYRVYSRS